jgi:hypothetical protein
MGTSRMKQAGRGGCGASRQEGENPWRRNVSGEASPGRRGASRGGQVRRRDHLRVPKGAKPWEVRMCSSVVVTRRHTRGTAAKP